MSKLRNTVYFHIVAGVNQAHVTNSINDLTDQKNE